MGKVDPTTQPDKNAKYAKQAMLLKEMGFSDQELNLRLLAENGGDVKSVVAVLATAGSCTDESIVKPFLFQFCTGSVSPFCPKTPFSCLKLSWELVPQRTPMFFFG